MFTTLLEPRPAQVFGRQRVRSSSLVAGASYFSERVGATWSLWRRLLGRRGIFTTLQEPPLRCQHRLLGVRGFELLGRWRKLFASHLVAGAYCHLEPRLRCHHRLLGVRGFELLGRWRKLFASYLVAGAYSQSYWSHDCGTSTGVWASEGSSYLVAQAICKLFGRGGCYQHRFLGVRGFELLGRCGARYFVAGAEYSQPLWNHDYVTSTSEGSSYFVAVAQAIWSRGHIHNLSGATITFSVQVFGCQSVRAVRATWSLAQAIWSRDYVTSTSFWASEGFLAMFMGWLVGGVLSWILKLGHRWLVAGLS